MQLLPVKVQNSKSLIDGLIYIIPDKIENLSVQTSKSDYIVRIRTVSQTHTVVYRGTQKGAHEYLNKLVFQLQAIGY